LWNGAVVGFYDGKSIAIATIVGLSPRINNLLLPSLDRSLI